MEIRGSYYSLGHNLNVVSFDSYNGTFISDSSLTMTGTGTLRTNGLPSGGLNYLTIGTGAVVTLKSDVWILAEQGFTNSGTIIYNGFHIYLPEEANDGGLIFRVYPPAHENDVGLLFSDFSYCSGGPGQVFFIAQSFGAVSWSWDFGDGYESNQKNPSHMYLASGNYTVTLRVSDAFGDYAVASRSITVIVPIVPSYSDGSSIMIITIVAVAIVGLTCLLYVRRKEP
jgi:hypothetical protein